MTNEELKEKLLAAPKNGFTGLTEAQRAEMESYCRGYMAFMDACKTEREATAWTEKAAIEHGFVALQPGMEVKPGDKVYMNNRGKSIILAVIGAFIAFAIGYVKEMQDRRIRIVSDVEKYGFPILGVVPAFSSKPKKNSKKYAYSGYETYSRASSKAENAEENSYASDKKGKENRK